MARKNTSVARLTKVTDEFTGRAETFAVANGRAYTEPTYSRVYAGEFGLQGVYGDRCWHSYVGRYSPSCAVRGREAEANVAQTGEFVTCDSPAWERIVAAFAGCDDSTLGSLLLAAYLELTRQNVPGDCCRVAADALRDAGRDAEANLLLGDDLCVVRHGKVVKA